MALTWHDAASAIITAMRRVFPPPAESVSIADTYTVERPRPSDRPWVGVCMVASIDGSSVVEGRSGALSNANDAEVLATLRRLADVVLVGAGTVRAERYGPPKQAGLRIGVVTNSGNVDTSTPLFTSGAGFLVVPDDVAVTGADVLRAGSDHVDLPLAIERLTTIAPDVAYVQAEGGPRLNAALADADLIDEIDLTISPRVVGGSGARLLTGAGELASRFELGHLLVDEESFVFSRWVRRRAC